jgi:hypothetical protein
LLALNISLSSLTTSSLGAQTETKRPAIKQTRPPDRNPQYFPVGLFSKYPQLSEFEVRWYASELRGLQGPSLLNGNSKRGPATYLFLLVPFFAPSLVIRLTVNSGGTGTPVVKSSTIGRGQGDETNCVCFIRECERILQSVT